VRAARPGRHRRRTLTLACAVVAACGTGRPTDATAPWWSADGAPPGPSPVGFSVRMLRDPTRPTRSGAPRVVQRAVWYPAAAAGGAPLTYAGYVRLAAAETTSVDSGQRGRQFVNAYRAFLESHAVPDSITRRWLAASMLAVRDAPAADGRFSLVLVAQGNGEATADQCVLGEYLASYGYVVATSPSQTRLTGQPADAAQVGAAAEDQADDLALLRASVGADFPVAPAAVAVVGHSFGARSALLYAMRDSTVRAVVSWDGGIGTATARDVYERARSFRPAAVHVALLHFYETLDPFMAPDWETLRQLTHSDVRIVATSGLHHHHFTTLGAAARFPALARATGATQETARSFAAVLALTRAFLDATLRGDSAARGRVARDPRVRRLPPRHRRP
jgi:dienelactone hydrolase